MSSRQDGVFEESWGIAGVPITVVVGGRLRALFFASSDQEREIAGEAAHRYFRKCVGEADAAATLVDSSSSPAAILAAHHRSARVLEFPRLTSEDVPQPRQPSPRAAEQSDER